MFPPSGRARLNVTQILKDALYSAEELSQAKDFMHFIRYPLISQFGRPTAHMNKLFPRSKGKCRICTLYQGLFTQVKPRIFCRSPAPKDSAEPSP